MLGVLAAEVGEDLEAQGLCGKTMIKVDHSIDSLCIYLRPASMRNLAVTLRYDCGLAMKRERLH